jgi:hypothetical protein
MTKKILKLFISLLIFALFIVFFFQLRSCKNYNRYTQEQKNVEGQNIFTDKLYNNDQLTYDVKYLVDSFNFRISPSPCHKCSKHLILLGDSFVFGQGLADKQTLGFLLEKKTDEKVYNWGIRGFSIADFAYYKDQLKFDKVLQNKGNLLIIIQDFHLHRVLYGSNQLRLLTPRVNAYSLKNEKLIKADGFLSYVVRLKYYFFQIYFSFLSLWDEFVPSGSKALTSAQIQESLHVIFHSIEVIRNTYKYYIPQGKLKLYFITIDENQVSTSFQNFFALKYDLKIINLSQLGVRFSDVSFPDGHPQLKYNEFLSDIIMRDID